MLRRLNGVVEPAFLVVGAWILAWSSLLCRPTSDDTA
jgi:hypothetical protein